MQNNGGNQLSGQQLFRVIALVICLAGGALLLCLGGLVTIAVLHDGGTTTDVVNIAKDLSIFIIGLIPFLVREVSNAAGATGSNTSATTINTPAPVNVQANGSVNTQTANPTPAPTATAGPLSPSAG